MKRYVYWASLITAILGLGGCNEPKSKSSENIFDPLVYLSKYNFETGNLCIIKDLVNMQKCSIGDTLEFIPSSWGNEQMPIVAASYCNLNKSVVYNNAGVVCEYMPKHNESGMTSITYAALMGKNDFLATSGVKENNTAFTKDLLKRIKTNKEYIFFDVTLKNEHSEGAFKYINRGNGESIVAGDSVKASIIYYGYNGYQISRTTEEILLDESLFMYNMYKQLKIGDRVFAVIDLGGHNTTFESKQGMPMIFDFEIIEVKKSSTKVEQTVEENKGQDK